MYLMRAVKLTNYLLRLICALRFQEIIKKNNDFIHNFIIENEIHFISCQ